MNLKAEMKSLKSKIDRKITVNWIIHQDFNSDLTTLWLGQKREN